MIDFNRLIFQLTSEQKTYKFPVTTVAQHICENDLDKLMLNIGDYSKEFELMVSSDISDSILTSMVNIFFHFPLIQINSIRSDLKNYIYQWMIVNKQILTNFGINAKKINYLLNSGLDHESLLTLFSLMFNINIIVLNMDNQFQVYSCQNYHNLYVTLFQHSDFKYSAIKYKSQQKDTINQILGYMSVIEYHHPFIQSCLAIININNAT